MNSTNVLLNQKEDIKLININRPKLIYRLYEDGTFIKELL